MKQGIAAVFMMIVMGFVLLLGCSTSNSEETTEESTNETEEHDHNVDEDISKEESEASESGKENNQNIEDDVGEEQTSGDAADDPSNDATNNDEVVEEEPSSTEERYGENTSDKYSQDIIVDDAEKELIHEMTETFYTYLQEGQFEESINFMNPDYLEYLGVTERDYLNLYKDNQTLYDWKLEEFSIRTVDKVSLDVHVPELIEPLIHSSETYIVIVDLRVSFYNESTGAVEYVVLSVTEDNEWKIFGIVSY